MRFVFPREDEFQYSRAVDPAHHPSFAERFVRGVGQFLASLIYRVSAHGVDQLPPGGFLLLPNHLTWVDAVVLQLACPRPIRFIVFADIYNLKWLHPIFHAVGALPISPRRAKGMPSAMPSKPSRPEKSSAFFPRANSRAVGCSCG